MFTGIVAGTGNITSISGKDVIRIDIDFCNVTTDKLEICLLYTSDAADEE